MRNFIILIFTLLLVPTSHAKTYQVGAGRTYTSPSKVMPLVANGDSVAIDAGLYSGDVGAWTKDSLYIYCPDLLRAHLDANGKSSGSKAIWVITGNHTTIENIEFSGATVPDKNGAGIRQEGAGLIVRHCYFHDNEDGILAGDNANSDIVIERSEFSHNGYGDGYSHNMYINHVRSFTLKFCYSHHAKIGHNVKSRAYNSYILYNRIMDEADGTSSYLIDLPNGGNAIVLGNVMMKGMLAENRILVNYGAEGLSNPTNELYAINNTMVTKRSSTTFINVANGTTTAKVMNNIFAGAGTSVGGSAVQASNESDPDIGKFGFLDTGTYNYHLSQSSTFYREGADPGYDGSFFLKPTAEYKEAVDSISRTDNPPFIGAFHQTSNASVNEIQRRNLRIQNFPNPFSERTTITLAQSVEDAMSLVLCIYNVAGDLVRMTDVVAQHFQIQFERAALPAGAYHYSLQNQSGKNAGKGNFIIE